MSRRSAGDAISEFSVIAPPAVQKPEEKKDDTSQPSAKNARNVEPDINQAPERKPDLPEVDTKRDLEPERSDEGAGLESPAVSAEKMNGSSPTEDETDGLAELDRVLPQKPKRARRKRSDEAWIKTQVELPESLLFRARSMVRPSRTGNNRSLGAAFVLQAYIRAVDDLVGSDIDTEGVGEDPDEMVERIKNALR